MRHLHPTGIALLTGMLLLLCQTAHGKKKASPYDKLDVFSRVLSLVEQHHVERVDEDAVMAGAIHGMLRALDPHSSWLPPDQFRILQEDTEGNFCGVGMEVSIRDDQLTVVAPIPDSPAMRAGIRTGDIIAQIDGRSTAAMDIEEAIGLMRGMEGTKVTIAIRREGAAELLHITLTRAPIEIESVRSEVVSTGILHVMLRSFTDGAAARLREAIRTAKTENGPIIGIVLDMRGNPGGLMYEAVKVSDLFMDRGIMVSTRGRDGAVVESFEAKEAGTIAELPVIVMIDGASASASEIVAGALQDSGRAIVLGVKSFGKGSVQTIIPMRDGSGLKLTTALYYTPSGVSIQARGIVPDVLVESRTAPTTVDGDAPDMKESDLPGHLDNGIPTADDAAAIDDFQLRMAVQLLCGIARQQETLRRNR
jgi:carboxyl-terminal processing protease